MGLKQHTLYTAEFFANGTLFSRRCFKTPPHLSRAVDWHEDIQMFSGGCFAFGGTPAEIRACLCGARHSDGRWARNDDDADFEWQISAAERTRLGCRAN